MFLGANILYLMCYESFQILHFMSLWPWLLWLLAIHSCSHPHIPTSWARFHKLEATSPSPKIPKSSSWFFSWWFCPVFVSFHVKTPPILKGKRRSNVLKKKKNPRQNVFQISNVPLATQWLSLVLIPFIPMSDHILNMLHAKVNCLCSPSGE